MALIRVQSHTGEEAIETCLCSGECSSCIGKSSASAPLAPLTQWPSKLRRRAGDLYVPTNAPTGSDDGSLVDDRRAEEVDGHQLRPP